jgi:hypothetical protein
VTTNGAVLSGLDITGTVTVAADNVTIEKSRITRTSGGSGSYAVILNDGADGFTIRDSEVLGPASDSDGLESAVWNHYNNPGATAERVYFHRCADCWEGAGTFRDDYMVVDAAYGGSHDEDIYVCGTTVNVDHSTLINTHQQTATVFGDTICGGNDFTVTDSLLAGGGFVLYPQANSSSETGSTYISGNRIARCGTSAIYNPNSGGTACSGGADAFGYYPLGGYYGVSAYTYSGPDQIWVGNVWDDSGQPICAGGEPGCGSPSPPPPEEPPEPPEEESEPPEEEPSPPEEEPAPPEEEPEPPNEEPEAPATPPTAVWTPPSNAEVGVPVLLDGSESSGEGPLSCVWSFENSSGSVVWETHSGCELAFTFAVADTKYVRLTVIDADGELDASRQSFAVTSGSPGTPGEPPPPESPESEPPVPPGPEPPGASAPGTPVARAAAPPAGAPGAQPGPRPRAIWVLPTDTRPGQMVTLVGTAAGDEPASCRWVLENRTGSRVFRRARGCQLRLRMPRTGVRYLRLTVRDAYGRKDSLRGAISGPASGSPGGGAAERLLGAARSASG